MNFFNYSEFIDIISTHADFKVSFNIRVLKVAHMLVYSILNMTHSKTNNTVSVLKKDIYNRSTNSEVFCAIQ